MAAAGDPAEASEGTGTAPDGAGSAVTASASSPPSLPGDRRRPAGRRAGMHLAIAALLVAATCLLYAGDLGLGFFALDDPGYVTDNPWIRGVTAANVSHILTRPYFTLYAPTHLLSYMADHALGGLDPRVFHLSSNLWAAIAAVLVYALGVALTGDALLAALAGVLFVAAPVHVEAIVWISSRKDLVATVGALLALLAHVHGRRQPYGGRRRLAYVAALAAFALGVGAKQSVAILPLVLLAHDVLVADRRLASSLADKVPYLVIAIAVTVPSFGALPETHTRPPLAQLLAAPAAYLWLLTGLGDLVIFRDPLTAIGAVVAGVLLGVVAAAVVVPWRGARRVPAVDRFLVAWLVLAILPTLATAVTGRGGPGLHPVADRYLFWPSTPFALLVARGALAAGRRLGARGVAVAAALVLVLAGVWAARTLAYLAEWRDPRSVWFAATARSDDAYVHTYLASHLLDAAARIDAARVLPPELPRLLESFAPGAGKGEAVAGEWRDGGRGGPLTAELRATLRRVAWQELEQADRVRGARVLPNLYYARGMYLLADRQLAQARREFERAYEQGQAHAWEEKRRSFAVLCHYAMGFTALQAKDHAEALRWVRLADEEQARYGGNWIPDLPDQRRRLEALAASAVR